MFLQKTYKILHLNIVPRPKYIILELEQHTQYTRARPTRSILELNIPDLHAQY